MATITLFPCQFLSRFTLIFSLGIDIYHLYHFFPILFHISNWPYFCNLLLSSACSAFHPRHVCISPPSLPFVVIVPTTFISAFVASGVFFLHLQVSLCSFCIIFSKRLRLKLRLSVHHTFQEGMGIILINELTYSLLLRLLLEIFETTNVDKNTPLP